MVSATSVSQARAAVAQALAAGTTPGGLPAAPLLERGSLKLYFYEPRGEDKQPPHDQDEVYIVISGSGIFAIGDREDSLERRPFGPGDAIFAPAGAIHRFEDFNDDFGTWVIMYGPQGGENPNETTFLKQPPCTLFLWGIRDEAARRDSPVAAAIRCTPHA